LQIKVNQKSHIKRICAFVILVLFSFSITPKRYFHDLLASHVDTSIQKKVSGNEEVNKSGFNCDCDTLVATSPFTEENSEIVISLLPVHISHYTSFIIPLYTASHSFIELRGPPAVG